MGAVGFGQKVYQLKQRAFPLFSEVPRVLHGKHLAGRRLGECVSQHPALVRCSCVASYPQGVGVIALMVRAPTS